MATRRWKFSNKNTDDTIWVADRSSALALSQLLKRTEPLEWRLSKEQDTTPFAPLQLITTPPEARKSPRFPVNRRQHARHAKHLRVVLISGSHTFRTYCTNVSLGGMLLSSPVPHELIGQKCRVILSRPEDLAFLENIEFDCQVIDDQGTSKRIQFLDMSEKSRRSLESWLPTSITVDFGEQEKIAA